MIEPRLIKIEAVDGGGDDGQGDLATNISTPVETRPTRFWKRRVKPAILPDIPAVPGGIRVG